MENFQFKPLEAFKTKPELLKPAAGRILISEPFLSDFYFKRSVVLLADYNEEGAFGLIVNKPLGIPIYDIIENFPYFEAEVHLGGPVKKNSLFFIHTLGDKVSNSYPIINGISFGGNMDDLKDLIIAGEVKPEDVKFFLGYAGWGPKQLDDEMNRNSWVVGKAKKERIMDNNTVNLWKDELKELGGYYAMWTLFPTDPTLN